MNSWQCSTLRKATLSAVSATANPNVQNGVQRANLINICILIYLPSHVIFRIHSTTSQSQKTLYHKDTWIRTEVLTDYTTLYSFHVLRSSPWMGLIQPKSQVSSAILSLAAVCLFYLTCAEQGSHKSSETRSEFDKRYFVTTQVLTSPSVPFNTYANSTVNFPYFGKESFNTSFLPNGLVEW
jgi:hypothetical protein